MNDDNQNNVYDKDDGEGDSGSEKGLRLTDKIKKGGDDKNDGKKKSLLFADRANSREKTNSPKKKAKFNEPPKKELLRLLSDDEFEAENIEIASPKNQNQEAKRKKMNRMSKRRFGHTIKFDKYKTSNVIKIISITLAIIIIPLEIFVQNVLQDAENDMIVQIQRAFGSSKGINVFMNIPLILVRPETTCFFMFLFYLSTDSLIAFKSAITTCFGIYLITFLKLLYKDGRPFWINPAVIGYECTFDFAGPSYHLYIITFFWAYNIIMYCMKYAEDVNNKVIYLLFGALSFMAVWIIIAGLYTGTIYIYQNIIGMLYGLIFLVLCMNFDTEIHRMCEKTGFIVQSSRKYKFYLFFLCIGLFVVALIYYNCELDQWTMPQTWVVNASEPDQECKDKLLQSSNNRLGLDQTFFYTAILFFITGMGFGTSYSLVHVDCLDWVHTRPLLRAIRGIVGCGISIGVFFLFQLIPSNDEPTKYFFQFAMPSLVLSFFIYGVYPILCLKLKLVKNQQTQFQSSVNQTDRNDSGGVLTVGSENFRSNSNNDPKQDNKFRKQNTKRAFTTLTNKGGQLSDEDQDLEQDIMEIRESFKKKQRTRLLGDK